MAFAPEFIEAVSQNDPDALRNIFIRNPEFRSRINEPLFAFDSPAIVFAASQGKRQITDALLDNGADVNARSKWWAGGFGVLDNNHHELASYLIQRGARIDAHALARHGMVKELRELLMARPELVHARGGDGQTPLHVAASVEIAELLIEAGADIDALDIDHESTPAQYLIRSHPEVMRYLVDRGCRTDILMEAALGDLDRIRRRLEADPESIRMRVNDHYFPKRNPRAGGTIYIWTLSPNRSPHQVAALFSKPAALDLLLQHSPPDLLLAQACLTGRPDLVQSLITRNPDEVRSLAQANPGYVSDAAEDNNTEAVRLMLKAGWPITGNGSRTPLHFACWNGSVATVQAILPFQPPLEILDGDYHATPLGWAIHGSQNSPFHGTGDYAATVEVLLAAGAKRPETIAGSEAVQAVLRRRP